MGLCASTTSTTNDIARSIPNASLHSPKTSVYRSQLTDELFNPVKRRPSTLHLQTLLETKDLRDSFAEYVKQTNSAQRKIQFWLDCYIVGLLCRWIVVGFLLPCHRQGGGDALAHWIRRPLLERGWTCSRSPTSTS